MKLVDLEPEFLVAEDERTSRRKDTLEGADGIIFVCPKCLVDNGGKRPGVHSVICWFVGRVSADRTPTPGRWTPTGTGYADLSFVDSPGLTCSVQLGGSCHAHFCITNGEIVFS